MELIDYGGMHGLDSIAMHGLESLDTITDTLL
jgi:hypothetical protein